MKVYTKTGDCGTTGLVGGLRVLKDHPTIELLGDLDELNAHLGLLKLEEYQSDIMTISAIVAGANLTLDEGRIASIESEIDRITSLVPNLTSFIMPTGREQSEIFIARAVCRRAERHAIDLVNHDCRVYLNRLSDYLFMLGYGVNVNATKWPLT